MQKMTIVLGLILIITAVATGVPRVGNCESRGGVQIGAQCLEFNVQKQSWSRAKAECESRGNKLASLKDLRMVMNYRSRAFGHTGFWDANFWVGGSDRSNEGTWEWLDGTRFDNSFWSPGEPNGGRNENCLMTFNNTGFNDWECDGARIGFICEIENTVTPNPGPTTAQPPNHVPTTAEPGTSDKFCDSIVIKENTWHEGWSGHMLFSPSGDVDGWEATITFDSYVDKFETQQGDMLLSTSGTSFKIKNKSWNAIPQTLPMKIGILYRFTSGSPAPKVVSIKFNDEILCGLAISDAFKQYGIYWIYTAAKKVWVDQGIAKGMCANHFNSTLPYPTGDLHEWQKAVFEASGGDSGWPWVGATRAGDGRWYWPDGSTVPQEAWQDGFPRNLPEDGCANAVSSSAQGITTNGQLWDTSCKSIGSVLCQGKFQGPNYGAQFGFGGQVASVGHDGRGAQFG